MTKLYTDLREKAAKTAPDVELERENGRKKKCSQCTAENASVSQMQF